MVISSLFFRFFFLFLQHAIYVREEVERDDDDASASKERAGHITPAQLFIYISADTYTCPLQGDLLSTDTKHLVSGCSTIYRHEASRIRVSSSTSDHSWGLAETWSTFIYMLHFNLTNLKLRNIPY